MVVLAPEKKLVFFMLLGESKFLKLAVRVRK